VVEGIESEAQAEKARSWGVDYMQGYLYSEPLPKESFIKFAGLEKYENVMQNA
jgi:sensor c-di-GMP phosphodiesterase-like protein